MTLEALYEEIGGNYQSMLERFRTQERIEKFVLLFLKDQSYRNFMLAMEEENAEEAFRAIHTLKGICMNLSFDRLYIYSSRITECLRGQDISGAAALLPKFEACYEQHFQTICAYANS